MHIATKRAVIAAAAVAAAGLFGSLGHDGSTVAQSGVPVVHHDVALVDSSTDAALAAASTADYTPLGLAETAYDQGLYTNLVGSNGLEYTLYESLGANANAYLDTAGTGGIYGTALAATEYLNDFNGSFTALYDGYLSDAIAFEDGLNNLVGGESALMPTLQTAFTDFYIPPAGGLAADLNPADATTMAGFQTDLTELANSDFSAASSDFTGYLTYLGDSYTELAKLGFDGTTVTSIVEGLSKGLESTATALSTDFTQILTELGTLF